MKPGFVMLGLIFRPTYFFPRCSESCGSQNIVFVERAETGQCSHGGGTFSSNALQVFYYEELNLCHINKDMNQLHESKRVVVLKTFDFLCVKCKLNCADLR